MSGRAKRPVGVILEQDGEPVEMKRWFDETGDIRHNLAVSVAIADFLKSHGVRSVVVTDGIIGCPHEEGIDYPDGGVCPHCPFWAGRDRWAG
jgi:hypothetical protein